MSTKTLLAKYIVFISLIYIIAFKYNNTKKLNYFEVENRALAQKRLYNGKLLSSILESMKIILQITFMTENLTNKQVHNYIKA